MCVLQEHDKTIMFSVFWKNSFRVSKDYCHSFTQLIDHVYVIANIVTKKRKKEEKQTFTGATFSKYSLGQVRSVK